ncbi:MAG: flagellar motor protein [Bryobacteraceae bacterium]|jgi:chemotaxis protein MotA
MATPTATNKKASKPASAKLDFATVAGILIALAGIVGGLILEKGDIADIAQSTAALIVLGGTCGAVLVTTPMPVALRALRSLRAIFFEERGGAAEIVAKLIYFSGEARKNGIVSLEQAAAAISDPFLRKAMSLAVDGADLQDLRRMMEVDIGIMEQNGEAEARVWEAAGGYAPTIGIIGAVLGLIQVMKHLEDIREVGHGIAVAFVATVYGVGSANLFFLPIAAKLRARLRDAMLVREMVLEGVSGIAQGMNPTLIRIKLESFVPPVVEPKKAKAATANASAAASNRSQEAA